LMFRGLRTIRWMSRFRDNVMCWFKLYANADHDWTPLFHWLWVVGFLKSLIVLIARRGFHVSRRLSHRGIIIFFWECHKIRNYQDNSGTELDIYQDRRIMPSQNIGKLEEYWWSHRIVKKAPAFECRTKIRPGEPLDWCHESFKHCVDDAIE
jgi:hypothetical protein